MKKRFFAVLLTALALGASSCKKDPKLPTPSVEEFPQIFTVVASSSTFKVTDIQGSGNPTATFSLDVRGDASQVDAIEIYRTFRGFNVPAITTPVTNPVVGLGGPTVLLRTVPPVSGNVTVAIDELITGLTRPSGPTQTGARVAVTRASLRATEGFFFTYALRLKGGRRIEYNQSFNAAPFAGTVAIVP